MDALVAIVSSPTFWSQTAVLGGCFCFSALTLLALVVWRHRRYTASNSLWLDERGAAEASDFALTFPILLFVVMLMVQLAMATNASLIVHYAAFSAARAARAYAWERTPVEIRVLQQVRRQDEVRGAQLASASFLGKALAANGSSRNCTRAADAARAALVAATPSTLAPRAYEPPRGGGCGGSEAWGSFVLQTRRAAEQAAVNEDLVLSKARYAFSPQNTIVELVPDYIQQLRALDAFRRRQERDSLPITAMVRFRYPLVLPVGRLFGSRDTDGLFKYELRAQVQVL